MSIKRIGERMEVEEYIYKGWEKGWKNKSMKEEMKEMKLSVGSEFMEE